MTVVAYLGVLPRASVVPSQTLDGLVRSLLAERAAAFAAGGFSVHIDGRLTGLANVPDVAREVFSAFLDSALDFAGGSRVRVGWFPGSGRRCIYFVSAEGSAPDRTEKGSRPSARKGVPWSANDPGSPNVGLRIELDRLADRLKGSGGTLWEERTGAQRRAWFVLFGASDHGSRSPSL